jgi:hypothetical protein
MTFLFDGGWGHTQVKSVDHPLPASAFDGKYYEWNYSRVYLSAPAPGSRTAYNGPHAIPGTIQAEDYDTGGFGVAYNQSGPGAAANDLIGSGEQTGFRADNNGNIHPAAGPGGGGYALGWSHPGDWYKYTVRAVAAGRYTATFQVADGGPGGTFHLEDEAGRDLTGPVTAPDTGGWGNWKRVTSSAFSLKPGPHTLRLVEDTAGPGQTWVCDFDWFSLAPAVR